MPKLRVTRRVIGFALLLLMAFAIGDFARRTQTTFVASAVSLPGVVFTGQFSRVDAGLDLLEHGFVTPLLISGANPGAGISVTGFADQFKLSPALRTALTAGTLVLGADANSTLENVQEARRWLSKLPAEHAVVLITSRFHLPRASLALEQALGDRHVLRYAVPDDAVQYVGVIVEFWKYVGTFCGLAFGRTPLQ